MLRTIPRATRTNRVTFPSPVPGRRLQHLRSVSKTIAKGKAIRKRAVLQSSSLAGLESSSAQKWNTEAKPKREQHSIVAIFHFNTGAICNRTRRAASALLLRVFWFPYLALATALTAQEPSIRVPVRLVSIPALVVSKDGKYIPGLDAKQFSVADNGRKQRFQLDTESLPVSVAVVLQCDYDVRDYMPFILKVGTLLSDSLAASTGEAALVTYNDEVEVAAAFSPNADLREVLRKTKPSGHQARLADGGLRAVEMLRQRPAAQSRVLLFIGQPVDHGSQRSLAKLLEEAQQANVQIFALRLPVLTKAWISETFGFQTFGSQWYKGGFEAKVELTKLVPALRRAGEAGDARDPFSILTVATGGVQLPFRKQQQLEDGIIAIGTALRSRYFLSFTPSVSADHGDHALQVNVDVPDAKVYARPSYQVAP